MKINGKTFTQPPAKEVVIPHGDDMVVFKLQAILDYSEFDALCPLPRPPFRTKVGGESSPVYDDPGYRKATEEWALRRSDWMVLKTLEPTEGLEWTEINMSEPSTWGGWRKEMSSAGFTDSMLAHLVSKITEINGLDQEKIEKATRDFLATRELRQKAQSSLPVEVSSTPSGEPVNA